MPDCQCIPVLPRQRETAVKEPTALVLARTVLLWSVLICLSFLISCSERAAEHRLVKAENGEIRLAVSEFRDGNVHFFTYKKSGRNINFFVRTDGAGNLSTHFDACYTCYKKKKGYRQEGADLVCNECSLRFRLADEKWLHEGCSPIPLASRIDKGFIVIKAGDIEEGERLF
jgi:uncharacterized membrane protein